MIREVAFFAYSVRDVRAAEKFYRDVLGLQPGEANNDHWIEFNVGATTFGIGNGESLGAEPGKSHGAAFEVDDLNVERERLLASGVEVSEIFTSPVCVSAFVTDPEGNKFALHTRNAQT